MKQATIITIVLAVLVLISAVQAIQLNSLKNDINEGEIEIGVANTKSTSSNDGGTKRTSSVPSSIKDLPTMVGGC